MRVTSFARFVPGTLLLLLLVTGCRTYGDYGAEAEIPRQMQQTVEQFAGELDRAQSDVKALAEAVEQNDALAPLEEQYRDLINRHEAFLEGHRRIAEHFQDGGTYRALHRNYRTMISEQHLVRSWYNELHVRVRRVGSGEPAVGDVPPASRYVVNPSYYDRVQNRQRLTMRAALQGG